MERISAIFALLENGRLYRSLDNGDSWGWPVRSPSTPVTELAADPLEPGTLWVSGSTAVFRSRDHGAYWARVSGDDFQPFPPLGPSKAGQLYARSSDGFFEMRF